MKKRQQDIYDFIEEYISERHYSPTVREIAKAVGLSSTSSVHGHLKRMRRRGTLILLILVQGPYK